MCREARISPQMWSLAEGIGDDLRAVVAGLQRGANPTTPIELAFRFWCIGLGVLVHEYLLTAIRLLEKGPSRIAFVIPRFVLEASLRLRRLYLEAESIRESGGDLEKAEAVKSWRAAPKRLDEIFKRVDGDFSDMTPEEVEAYRRGVDKAEQPRNLKLEQLLSVVEGNVAKAAIRGRYDLKSSYVHVNEVAVDEAIRGSEPEEIALNWKSKFISRRQTLEELIHYTHDLLSMICVVTSYEGLEGRLGERYETWQRLFGSGSGS